MPSHLTYDYSKRRPKRDSVWTDAQKEKLKRIYPVTADNDLQKHFPDFSLAHIKTKANRLGLKKIQGRWTAEEEAELLIMWEGADSLPLLAEKFKRKPGAILRKYYKLVNAARGQDLLT